MDNSSNYVAYEEEFLSNWTWFLVDGYLSAVVPNGWMVEALTYVSDVAEN